MLPAARLEALGYKIAIYPLSLLLTAAQAMQDLLARLHEDTRPPTASQISFQALQALVGFSEYDRTAARYEGPAD